MSLATFIPEAPRIDRLPRYLYKYRSLAPGQSEYTRRILTHNELFFASPLNFNDPFENYFSLDIRAVEEKFVPMLQERQKRGFSEVPFWWIVEAIDKWRLNIRRDYLKTIGIVSLSQYPDNILLWSHYADSHQGVCFEFDLEEVGTFIEKSAIMPVVYSQRCPTSTMASEHLVKAVVHSMYTKAEVWSYEGEWRFVRRHTGPGPATFPSLMLSGIIFGADISAKDRDSFLILIKKYQPHVNVGIACKDPWAYGLRLFEVGKKFEGDPWDPEASILTC